MTERRRIRVDGKRQATPRADPSAPADCSCPRLAYEDWHDVESDWTDIAFVRTSVNAVLGVPVGYHGAKVGLEAKARKLGFTIPDDAMVLMGAGRFRRALLLEVDGATPSVRGVFVPGGVAYTRLVEAPWGEMRKRVDEMRDLATQKYGRAPADILVWYLTCRVCSSERNFETLLIAHYRE
jgi:hypothetical protein